jgi:hypothetical protein
MIPRQFHRRPRLPTILPAGGEPPDAFPVPRGPLLALGLVAAAGLVLLLPAIVPAAWAARKLRGAASD